MTEAEWLTCNDPEAMLKFILGNASDRKLRLFAVACCRRIWHLLRSQPVWVAVEMSERWADQVIGIQELALAETAIKHVWPGNGAFTLESFPENAALFCAKKGKRDLLGAAFFARMGGGSDEGEKQIELIRDIFGNPFRPFPINPTWLNWNHSIVLKLAQAIYQDRRVADMPILADALEEAGCTNDAFLGHCRGGASHVRGCWVVDLLLGKE